MYIYAYVCVYNVYFFCFRRTVSREDRKKRELQQQEAIPMGKDDVGALDDLVARDRGVLLIVN
jgi:hypothetical protein